MEQASLLGFEFVPLSSHMRKSHRHSITIKDAKGAVVLPRLRSGMG